MSFHVGSMDSGQNYAKQYFTVIIFAIFNCYVKSLNAAFCNDLQSCLRFTVYTVKVIIKLVLQHYLWSLHPVSSQATLNYAQTKIMMTVGIAFTRTPMWKKIWHVLHCRSFGCIYNDQCFNRLIIDESNETFWN